MTNNVRGGRQRGGIGQTSGWPPPVDSALATAIIDVTRELARSVPPPRGAPYFCLDADVTYDLGVFDAVCARGIFRKYEFALDIGSGLGGRARWLAARSGCRILGVDPRPSAVVAAARLNRRAHMDDHVSFLVGGAAALPLRERLFTHVWWLDASPDTGMHATLAESFRVLRRGGHFSLQTALSSVSAREALLAALASVGFIELVGCEAPLSDVPDAVRIARARLGAALQRTGDGCGSARPQASAAAPICFQIFGRRPA